MIFELVKLILNFHSCNKRAVLNFGNFYFEIFKDFLALLDCVSRANAVAWSSVRPSSVKRVFSETIKRINTKLVER